ncbi:MAG: prolipoprotein diacylglyceryl transferase [Bacteroidales bacterium]|jgi:phosphatidylglycerol:prolipoprotein diacylglycerol transferase|nr:prolipoprotein diacylglyceryl transferase [Bacteroidales bacterium]MDD2688066.1 prolipoprotein diacylglyceryl transferase [Bacteroidales bacterium]MDD3331399.1 prolipoprotein diacylglyceryl transferase [Bacteroidales bacterium]MDD3692147.1 prolipoprotein diacylglyceryl transferase [Bacteroidales bacterium]MDD3939796.1 prolipoprotein diacylglyceryl transferase [Patescibacteria group bacterium]
MLNYIIWGVDPVLFDFGILSIRWYGLFLVTGFIISTSIFYKIAIKEGFQEKLLDSFIIYTITWTIIGLRLGHCLFYEWEYYKNHLLEIFIPFTQTSDGWEFIGYQGLASHGGTMAIILFVVYFSKRHKINLIWLLDRLSIVIPMAAAFVRIGNLMNSEIIGTVTTVPWGFSFMQLEGTKECCDPRHPAQLYESLVYFSLFIYQMWYYFKKTKGHISAGRSVGILLVVIFTARFFIEFIKENQVGFEETMVLNMGQILSIPFILLGIIFLCYSFKNKKICSFSKK